MKGAVVYLLPRCAAACLALLLFTVPAGAGESREAATTLFEEAQYLEKVVGDVKKAAELYGRAAADAEFEQAAEALYRKARCEIMRGDSRSALRSLDAALEKKNCPESVRTRVENMRRKIQDSAARLRARVRASDVQQVLNNLADIISRIKEEARKMASGERKFPGLDPASKHELRRSAALIVSSQISSIISEAPDRAGLLRFLANRDFRKGYSAFLEFRYPEALEFFSSALAYDPDHIDAADFQGFALYITGETPGSGAEFYGSDQKPKLPQQSRQNLLRLASLGREHLSAGEHEQALYVFERALDLYQWEHESFGNEADISKNADRIREGIRTAYRWLNPREAAKLGALRDERNLLISNIRAGAVELADAAYAAAGKAASEETAGRQPSDARDKNASAPVSGSDEGEKSPSAAGKESLHLNLQVLTYRSEFFGEAGVKFQRIEIPNGTDARYAFCARLRAKDFEALIARGRKGGDLDAADTVESEVLPGGSVTMKSGITIPYLLKSSGGDDSTVPVIGRAFEGVTIEAALGQDAADGKNVLSIVITVSDFTGSTDNLPTEKGKIEIPRITAERVAFSIRIAQGEVCCFAPFSNPAATGVGAFKKAGGRTSLSVCLSIEQVK